MEADKGYMCRLLNGDDKKMLYLYIREHTVGKRVIVNCC